MHELCRLHLHEPDATHHVTVHDRNGVDLARGIFTGVEDSLNTVQPQFCLKAGGPRSSSACFGLTVIDGDQNTIYGPTECY